MEFCKWAKNGLGNTQHPHSPRISTKEGRRRKKETGGQVALPHIMQSAEAVPPPCIPQRWKSGANGEFYAGGWKWDFVIE